MKKMNFAEFSKRTEEVVKARKIFTPHITQNISVAFELYQEVLAEEKLNVFISTMIAGHRPMTPIDDYVRPQCPECKAGMMLQIGTKDMEGTLWPTAWHCTECLTDYYSDKTVEQWMKELERADHAK